MTFIRKHLPILLVLLALGLGFISYVYVDVESYVWKHHPPAVVTKHDTEKLHSSELVGSLGDKTMPLIKTAAQWDALPFEVDVVRLDVQNLTKTKVYSLARGEQHFTRRRNGASGRRKASVKTMPVDMDDSYIPYAIVTLPDGHSILAQMDRPVLRKLQKKEPVFILGQKIGVSAEAKRKLSAYQTKGLSLDTCFYAVNAPWKAAYKDRIFFLRLGIAAVVFLVSGVALLTMYYRLAQRTTATSIK